MTLQLYFDLLCFQGRRVSRGRYTYTDPGLQTMMQHLQFVLMALYSGFSPAIVNEVSNVAQKLLYAIQYAIYVR